MFSICNLYVLLNVVMQSDDDLTGTRSKQTATLKNIKVSAVLPVLFIFLYLLNYDSQQNV